MEVQKGRGDKTFYAACLKYWAFPQIVLSHLQKSISDQKKPQSSVMLIPTSVDASYEQSNMQSLPVSLLRATKVCAGHSIFSRAPEVPKNTASRWKSVQLTLTSPWIILPVPLWRNLVVNTYQSPNRSLNCSNLWEIKAKTHTVKEIGTNALKYYLAVQPLLTPSHSPAFSPLVLWLHLYRLA